MWRARGSHHSLRLVLLQVTEQEIRAIVVEELVRVGFIVSAGSYMHIGVTAAAKRIADTLKLTAQLPRGSPPHYVTPACDCGAERIPPHKHAPWCFLITRTR